jgi:voltage-gated potassium channel
MKGSTILFPRRLLLPIAIPILLLAIGTVGYDLIEGWSSFDALYMTVITLTTVGFAEVHPLSNAGRTFTMFLALGGIFTLFYTATEIIRAVITGEVRDLLGRQQMERSLAQLRRHIIVCGYGRMGKLVCQQFSREGIDLSLSSARPNRWPISSCSTASRSTATPPLTRFCAGPASSRPAPWSQWPPRMPTISTSP